MKYHAHDAIVGILKLNPCEIKQPLIRVYDDEPFLERVNQALDSQYLKKIEEADLRQLCENFYNYFVLRTHV